MSELSAKLRLSRMLGAAMLVVMLGAGCTGDGDSSPDDASAEEGLAFDDAERLAGDLVDSAAVEDEPVTQDDIAVLLASGERMLADGPYEGAMYAAPELYVASAQMVCSRLSEGVSIEDVISEFMADNLLDAEAPADATLTGTVVGAGVQTLCPQHRDVI